MPRNLSDDVRTPYGSVGGVFEREGKGPEADSIAAAVDLITKPKLLLTVLELSKAPATPKMISDKYGVARSTASLQLRLLHAAGLAREVVGVDRRRTYYAITELGELSLKKARELLTNALIDKCGSSNSGGTAVLNYGCLTKALSAYGDAAEQVIKWLGVRERGGQHIIGVSE